MCLERVPLFRLQVRGVGQQIVEAAVVRDEVDRAFLANARHTADVVAGITHEREDVDDL